MNKLSKLPASKGEITVEVKQVYGKEMIYPVCDTAKLFTRFNNQKTITRNDLDIIRALGYTVAVQQVRIEP